MLYKLHTNFFIVGLLLIGFLAVIASDRSLCAMTLGTVIAFASQLLLLIYFSKVSEDAYSDRVLFLVTLIYSFFMGAVFMWISYYYEGDTFMLTKNDAMKYFDEGMKAHDLGFWDNAIRMCRKYDFDDYGGFLVSSFLLFLIPNKLFANAVYMLCGAVSVVMLFRIGRHYMPKVYAFEAALAYGTSSFMILFHCAFLKESVFIFFVIASMYFFFKAAIEKKPQAFIGTVICTSAIVFYRPAVAAFLVISFIGYYAVTQRGSAFSLFLYVMIAVALAVSMAFLQSQFDRYAADDTEALLTDSSSAYYSGTVNIIMGWFSAFFGPFPTLFPMAIKGRPVTTNYYGAGLTYRLFLAVPFWMGILFAVKRRNFDMLPVLAFVMIELLASAYVLASFELRKVLLQVPFMFLISFYGLYQMGKSEKLKPFMPLLGFAGYALTIGMLVLWNVIRVK